MNSILIVIGIMLLMFIFVRSLEHSDYDGIRSGAINSAMAILFILGICSIYIGATNNGIKEGARRTANDKIEVVNDTVNIDKTNRN